jgi:anti-sigma regulatory factor (Ser/Thr protein kinase)
MPERSLTLRNDVAEIERLSQAIGEMGAALPKDAVGEIQLAAEELVTNVIRHGYETGQPGTVDVLLRLDAGGFWMQVRDRGRPFDPLSKPDPDVTAPVEERKVGGLGILLVKRLMDEVHYRRVGDENVIETLKRVGPLGSEE